MEGSGPKKGVCISEERAIAPRKLVCQDRDVTGSANLVAIKVIFPTLYGEGGIGTVNASRHGLRTAMQRLYAKLVCKACMQGGSRVIELKHMFHRWVNAPPMSLNFNLAIVLFRWGVWE